MKISILTLFPDMFRGPFDASIVKRAKENGLVEIDFVNIRDFGIGKHKVIDDTPYGGGIGMVMRVDVLHKAISNVKCSRSYRDPEWKLPSGQMSNVPDHIGIPNGNYHRDKCNEKIVLLSASGKSFKQAKAKEFSKFDHLILICGHYEGVDERVKQFIDEEISIGDFVLTGGEIPAMLITDAVTRLLPGVLKDQATQDESFSYEVNGNRVLEYPHYTKPSVYENLSVPDVLTSGDHKKIALWREKQAVELTKKGRPDLVKAKD